MIMLWSVTIILLAVVNIASSDKKLASALDALEDILRRHLRMKIGRTSKVSVSNRILQISQLFRYNSNRKQSRGLFTCFVCESLVNVMITAKGLQIVEELIFLLGNICSWFTSRSFNVCHKLMNLHSVTILHILNITPNITAARVCSIVFQKDLGCRDYNRIHWKIGIPPYKPWLRKRKTGGEIMKIIQIPDIHYDPSYAVDSNAVCGDWLCCQRGSQPKRKEHKAGFWGDYRECDIPKSTYVNLLWHIANTHRHINYIYFTGDIIPHKIWDTDVKRNSERIRYTMRTLRRVFPRTPIYSVLGNHEAHPVNVFHPNKNSKWLFHLVKNEWQLPERSRYTIMKGGYYTILVERGFRIVALNSNVCYTFNWWLLYNDYDPYDQLKWLVKVLYSAEKNNEIVHILSHIPMSDKECLNNWITEYEKIVNRFAHIIAAQFNGHTHYDETVIVYNNSLKAINVAWNGGSVATYEGNNPNYKLYYVNSKTMEVVDFESWTFNLTHANAFFTKYPKWYKLYSFKQAYGLPNLSLRELEKLPFRIAKYKKLGDKYFRFRVRDADAEVTKGCNSACRWKKACDMISTRKRKIICARLKQLAYRRRRNVAIERT